MEKQYIEKRILYKARSLSQGPFTWADIQQLLTENNITLQVDDVLFHEYSEGYDDGDSMRDPMYDLYVYRYRLETDEEFERRKSKTNRMKEHARERRYEQYLKLKEEFENCQCKCNNS